MDDFQRCWIGEIKLAKNDEDLAFIINRIFDSGIDAGRQLEQEDQQAEMAESEAA